jgi:hypothetical protein
MMRGFWQLADMRLCVSRLPHLLQVCITASPSSCVPPATVLTTGRR